MWSGPAAKPKPARPAALTMDAAPRGLVHARRRGRRAWPECWPRNCHCGRTRGLHQCWAPGGPPQRDLPAAGDPGGWAWAERVLPDFKAHLRQKVCCGDNGQVGSRPQGGPPLAHCRGQVPGGQAGRPAARGSRSAQAREAAHPTRGDHGVLEHAAAELAAQLHRGLLSEHQRLLGAGRD